MVVDWTGTTPQVKGAINNTLSFTKAASYTGVRSVLPPGIPNNEGVFRAIEVICPPGTVGNGVLPAACAARGLTGFRMVDCMFGALAMMLPDKVKAAGDGGNTGISIGGYDADRKPFVYVDFTCGAWGARPWADGLDGNSHMFANMASHSIEVTEAEQPIQLTAYEFVAGQGGRRQVPRRRAVPPRLPLPRGRGHAAGALRPPRPPPVRPLWRQPGRAVGELPEPATARTALLPVKLTMTIKRGDVFRHELAGAGGWGDPLERDPAAVLTRCAQRAAVAAKARGRLRRGGRHRALDGRRGRDGAAPRRDPARARLERACRRCSGTIPMPLPRAPRSRANDQRPIASASISAAPSPTSCCSAPTAPSTPRRSRRASTTMPRRSSTGLSELFARDRPRPATRSTRSATARRSPRTRSSSTRARAPG